MAKHLKNQNNSAKPRLKLNVQSRPRQTWSPREAESRVITNFNYFFKPQPRGDVSPPPAYANNQVSLGINLAEFFPPRQGI